MVKLELIKDQEDGKPMWWVDAKNNLGNVPISNGRSPDTAWRKAARNLRKLAKEAEQKSCVPTDESEPR